ncbi:MAG: hypothetical protein KME35_08055 [Aphanocapsa sp. GSE-SYN-MK-11-07L]|jgi:hypothetical protein|nr:hypothetical protein [Aphanocapsa sp. GSE-SYN-MK-11-07L]
MPWELLSEKLLVNDVWTISDSPIDTEYLKLEFEDPDQTERVGVAAFSLNGERALTQIVRASLEPQVLEFKRFGILTQQKIGFRPWNPSAQSLRIKVYWWNSLNAATSALFARFTGTYLAARNLAINQLIETLTTKLIWQKFDCFYVFAAPNAADSLLNWKANSFNCTPVNNPTFAIDRGYTGNTTTSYLNTNFIPTAGTNNFTRFNAGFGIYSRTNNASGTWADIGNSGTNISEIRARRVTGISYGVNSNNRPEAATAIPDSLGLISVSRLTEGSISAYRNGVLNDTQTSNNALALEPNSFLIGATRNTTVAPQWFSGRQIAMAFIGAGLSAQEHSDLYAAVQLYLSTIGASV